MLIIFAVWAVLAAAVLGLFRGAQRPRRETDDETLARRRREALRLVNASYDESHPYWWN